MKVRANCNVKHDGLWRRSGEEFEIAATEFEVLKGYVELAETPVVVEPEKAVQPKRKTTRKAKAAE